MPFQTTKTCLEGVLLVQSPVFEDERGVFQETWNDSSFQKAGLPINFVQDNFSHSHPGVIRGLHYQIRQPQGKLIRVTRGSVLDVAVDLRRNSPTFGEHITVQLREHDKKMLWVPPGFAHGFQVLGDGPADVHYKCTDYYCPEGERTIIWNDPDLAIAWHQPEKDPVISAKDRAGQAFAQADTFLEKP